MSGLEQINLRFDRAEDRLLLRVSTTDHQEHRLWLTRSLVRLWWPKLVDQLHRLPPGAGRPLPSEPGSRSAVQAFEHEAALHKAHFGEPYRSQDVQPVQAAPLLVVSLRMSAHSNGDREFRLLPAQGPGVHLRLNPDLLHAFAKLLHEASQATGWDLGLAPPFELPARPATARLN